MRKHVPDPRGQSVADKLLPDWLDFTDNEAPHLQDSGLLPLPPQVASQDELVIFIYSRCFMDESFLEDRQEQFPNRLCRW